jgi:type II secretory pathway pseudopilin PulG
LRRGGAWTKHGFSLLEVLLGSILFAGILVYMANVWGLYARTVGNSRSRMIATFLAAQQLEECITAGYRGVNAIYNRDKPPLPIVTVIRGQAQRTEYRYTVDITYHPDAYLRERLKIITVSVKYADESNFGGKSEVVFRTMLTEN